MKLLALLQIKLKLVKRYKWRERGSCVVCVVNGALPIYL
jgi:hypothetical protein